MIDLLFSASLGSHTFRMRDTRPGSGPDNTASAGNKESGVPVGPCVRPSGRPKGRPMDWPRSSD